MELAQGITLIAATITMGLVAGLFSTFAHDIMPGLGRSDDRVFVAAFQAIDTAIDDIRRESIPLDLTELDSVRAFATSVRERLGGTPVHALVPAALLGAPDNRTPKISSWEGAAAQCAPARTQPMIRGAGTPVVRSGRQEPVSATAPGAGRTRRGCRHRAG